MKSLLLSVLGLSCLACLGFMPPPPLHAARATRRHVLPSGSDNFEVPNSVNVEELERYLGLLKRLREFHDSKERHMVPSQTSHPEPEKPPTQIPPGHVWVLLFGHGKETGIFTLSQDATGGNDALAFQDRAEALRFALALHAHGFPTARLQPISDSSLQAFCRAHSFGIKAIPSGVAVVPPEDAIHMPAAEEDDASTRLFTDSDLMRVKDDLERLWHSKD